MSDLVIQVFSRNVYGAAKIYPANKLATQFANLIGVKTFSCPDLGKIKAMGVRVDQVPDPAATIQVPA